jgi:hypothetical protein
MERAVQALEMQRAQMQQMQPYARKTLPEYGIKVWFIST